MLRCAQKPPKTKHEPARLRHIERLYSLPTQKHTWRILSSAARAYWMSVSSQLASARLPKDAPRAWRALRSVARLGAPAATGAKYLFVLG